MGPNEIFLGWDPNFEQLFTFSEEPMITSSKFTTLPSSLFPSHILFDYVNFWKQIFLPFKLELVSEFFISLGVFEACFLFKIIRVLA